MCAVKPSLTESCRMSFLPQNMYDYIPFLSHRWRLMVASPRCHTPLCCLSRSFVSYCFLYGFQAIQNSSVLFKSSIACLCNFSSWRFQICVVLLINQYYAVCGTLFFFFLFFSFLFFFVFLYNTHVVQAQLVIF